MNASLIVRILWERRRLRSHERWSRADLEGFQARRLGELRRHAYSRSAFYRRFHRGFEGRPLAELPVLTKAELMAADDEVVTAPEVRCACGPPFRLLSVIEGRAEDSLVLPKKTGGDVVIHPNVFHRPLEPLPVKEWQVIQEAERLRILLGRPTRPVEEQRLAASVTRDLRDAGAEPPPVHVAIVDAVTRTRLGKAPLIKALRVAPETPPGRSLE